MGVKTGDRVYSVTRRQKGKWGYHVVTSYEARARQRDGTLTWRLLFTFEECRSPGKAERLARERAEKYGCTFSASVRHNDLCVPGGAE